MDETQIKVGYKFMYIWVVNIEPKHRQIPTIDISFEQNMIAAERFLSNL